MSEGEAAHGGRATRWSRRGVLQAAALLLGGPMPMATAQGGGIARAVSTGADVLAAEGFKPLRGKRIGLITNHTGMIAGEHLADVLARTPGVRLAAILAPEHGFRGAAEAGAKFGDSLDRTTGAPILSLYGATRKPTPEMLRGLDALVFDIQDVGVRFYTYISTMGLAMQAAAAAGLPFVVLDRPNPLGGTYVSGFVLTPAQRSFVGQYPIPIVHGLTVGEIAHMMKGERWLSGLEGLDLTVVKGAGWQRGMRWPDTGRTWVATSPNIPTFEAALVYPGIGVVGETLVNEGRGTPTPFSLFGAPWLDARRLADRLTALELPGVRFSAEAYVPRPIPDVATNPRFAGQSINGVRMTVADVGAVQPLEIGMHALAGLVWEAAAARVEPIVPDTPMFHRIAGTRRLHQMLTSGASGADIIASWQDEVARFKDKRSRYLLYS